MVGGLLSLHIYEADCRASAFSPSAHPLGTSKSRTNLIDHDSLEEVTSLPYWHALHEDTTYNIE